MKLADHGGQNVAVGKVVVIAGTVEVGRHDATVVTAILPVVAFAKLDTGDFSDGVRLIGGLQRTGKQRILGHWLGRELGIDAT